jgi:hypothetical protein
MFCPKCGSADQTPESYCKRCGEWLPNVGASARGLGIMRNRSREQKVRKMRILELVSAGLSITSVALIIAFLTGSGARQLLNLAVLCGILVTLYQIFNFYLGTSIERKKQARDTHTTNPPDPQPSIAEPTAPSLPQADTMRFSDVSSVTEGTTRHLDPQLRDREKP